MYAMPTHVPTLFPNRKAAIALPGRPNLCLPTVDWPMHHAVMAAFFKFKFKLMDKNIHFIEAFSEK